MPRPGPPKPTLTLRVHPGDAELFRNLRDQLEARLPYGELSTADCFRMVVTSASAALNRGELPITASMPPGAVLPGKPDPA